jgi:hypothetical protein
MTTLKLSKDATVLEAHEIPGEFAGRTVKAVELTTGEFRTEGNENFLENGWYVSVPTHAEIIQPSPDNQL